MQISSIFTSARRHGRRHVAFAALALTANLVVTAPSAAQPTDVAADTPAKPVKDPCEKLKKADSKKGLMCHHGGDSIEQFRESSRSPQAPGLDRPAAPAPCVEGGVSGKRIEVIYGVPQDRVNNYASERAQVQTAVNDADGYLAGSQPGLGSQGFRWLCADGSSVTVRNVTLVPVGSDLAFTFDDMIRSLQNQISLGLGPVDYEANDRVYLTFVDEISSVYPYGGQGSLFNDDRADPALNRNNSTGSPKYSLIAYYSGDIALHELGHNLGAVQLSAPHSSGAWHCYDENDEMCYQDGGTYFTGGGSSLENCPSAPFWQFDCGHEDYYALQPASGSYLATHWNVATSGWLTGMGPTPLCPDASFEPDDVRTQARLVTLQTTETHAFCTVGDTDWIALDLTAGRNYRAEAFNLSSGNDTILDVYRSDGTLVASNDDSNGTLGSLVRFQVTSSGTYYVQVRPFSAQNVGTTMTYDLRVSRNFLSNGGFETDGNADSRPDEWTSNAAFAQTSVSSYEGSFAGRHRATNDSGHAIQQRFVLSGPPGSIYTMSGRVNIPTTADSFSYKLQVRWRSASNAIIRTSTVKTYTGPTSGWERATASIQAPTGATEAEARLVVKGLNGTIYVDDMVVRRDSA